jgi:hypothetical protein
MVHFKTLDSASALAFTRKLTHNVCGSDSNNNDPTTNNVLQYVERRRLPKENSIFLIDVIVYTWRLRETLTLTFALSWERRKDRNQQLSNPKSDTTTLNEP